MHPLRWWFGRVALCLCLSTVACAAWISSAFAASPASKPAQKSGAPAGNASGSATGAPGTPGEVLASKGLAKVNTTYVLRGERDLADALRAIAQAKSKMTEENRAHAQIEAKIKRAKQVFSELDYEHRQVMAKMETAKDATQQNQLIAKSNNLISQMNDARQYMNDQEKELAKAGDANKTKYINLILDTFTAAEGTQKNYEGLASDAQIKGAVTELKSKLGPTPEFIAQLNQVKNLRKGVTSETIDLKIEHGLPMIEVTLNKSHTRTMILDSGASIIALPAAIAKQIELTPAKDDPKIHVTMADGKIVEAIQTTLQSVRVGSFTVENVECAILPEELVAAEPLLGNTFLRNFVYKVDTAGAKLHLAQIGGDKPGDKKTPDKKTGK